MNMLEVKDLSFAYHKKLILQDIRFNIERGDFVGIIGPNGSGKSTLVKLILKTLTPLKGKIRIMGEDIKTFNGWSKIGYISQRSNAANIDFPATVEEVVGLNLPSHNRVLRIKPKDYKKKVYEALRKVHMQDDGKKLIGQLSGGQQQRVFIARVLAGEPEIMFLDEPTAGVDAKSEEAVYCLLARLCEKYGITIIMVTHDISAITVHANKLICLGEKGLVVHDTKEPVTEETLTGLYGYRVHLHKHHLSGCKHYCEETKGS